MASFQARHSSHAPLKGAFTWLHQEQEVSPTPRRRSPKQPRTPPPTPTFCTTTVQEGDIMYLPEAVQSGSPARNGQFVPQDSVIHSTVRSNRPNDRRADRPFNHPVLVLNIIGDLAEILIVTSFSDSKETLTEKWSRTGELSDIVMSYAHFHHDKRHEEEPLRTWDHPRYPSLQLVSGQFDKPCSYINMRSAYLVETKHLCLPRTGGQRRALRLRDESFAMVKRTVPHVGDGSLQWYESVKAIILSSSLPVERACPWRRELGASPPIFNPSKSWRRHSSSPSMSSLSSSTLSRSSSVSFSLADSVTGVPEVCRAFEQGQCSRGEWCKYLH